MIFGDCPYDDCNAPVSTACADKCPAFSKETCETCGREYWLKHSRIDPVAYTLKDFAEEYEIDEENRKITKKSENISKEDQFRDATEMIKK